VNVRVARELAADWVTRHAGREPDFLGAYLIGSSVTLLDDADVPLGSDIDVVVITSASPAPPKPGKILHAGALLDVTVLSWLTLSSADEVLASYHLAAGLRVDKIVADPTGRLRTLQEYVAKHFAEEVWVRRRCENVRERIETGFHGIDASESWPDQVMSWLFPTGQTAHVLLVAALRNPTVRLRYRAAREVLDQYDRSSLYPALLGLLGCAELTADRVEHHVAGLARTFDAAAAAAQTRFFFSSDITSVARPTAIDASRELIRAGDHREAMFWIVATYARCNKILAADGSQAMRRQFAGAFSEVLADLGIASTRDLLARARSVRLFLPELASHADAILAADRG
jgi:hypothetical protein